MAACASAGSDAGALRGSQTLTATQSQDPSPGPSPGKNTTTNNSSSLQLYRNTSWGVKRQGPHLFKTTIKKHGFHQQHPASQKRGNSSSQHQPQQQQQQQQQPAAQQNAMLSPLQEQLRGHLQKQHTQQLLRERLLQALGGSGTPAQQAGCSGDTASSSSVGHSASPQLDTCSPSAAQPLQPLSALAQKLQQALLTRALQQGQHLSQQQQQQQLRACPAAAVTQPQQQQQQQQLRARAPAAVTQPQQQQQQEEQQQQRQLLMQLMLQAADDSTGEEQQQQHQQQQQQQQQQQDSAASGMPREALIAKRLIEQAAAQVSPALGEQLHQQVMSRIEAAALVAAAAGYEFDLAAQLQQLLPDLAQQVQQSCSEAVARKAVTAAVSTKLQQSSGIPSAAAIAEVVARTTACAERTVKCVTSLIMQGYQPAVAAAAATFNASNAAAVAPPSDVQSSNADGGGSSSAAATGGPPAVTATLQALLQALQQLLARS